MAYRGLPGAVRAVCGAPGLEAAQVPGTVLGYAPPRALRGARYLHTVCCGARSATPRQSRPLSSSSIDPSPRPPKVAAATTPPRRTKALCTLALVLTVTGTGRCSAEPGLAAARADSGCLRLVTVGLSGCQPLSLVRADGHRTQSDRRTPARAFNLTPGASESRLHHDRRGRGRRTVSTRHVVTLRVSRLPVRLQLEICISLAS
eukprot:2885307-Rhodomonas_salina.1